MVERVTTVAFEGIEARAVDVQVQVAPGLPAFNNDGCQCQCRGLYGSLSVRARRFEGPDPRFQNIAKA